MKRFVEGLDRGQRTLFPETLEDFVAEDNSVRVIEAFVEALDLGGLGFSRVDPKATGRPSYHPSVLLPSRSSPSRRLMTGSSESSASTASEPHSASPTCRQFSRARRRPRR